MVITQLFSHCPQCLLLVKHKREKHNQTHKSIEPSPELPKCELMMAASCAVDGGCVSDYLAVAVAAISMVLLLSRLILPFLFHNLPRAKSSSVWIPVIQVFASFNLLLSIVMSANFLKLTKSHWWESCYIWAVWVEGPLGFGLLLSCRIVQASQLYYIFVKRCLPPIRSYISLPLILLPWIAGAALIHVKKPLNYHCHMGTRWILPAVSLHALHVIVLVAITRSIRHIEFRFDELRDLWQGILISSCSIGVWVAAYILNEVHDDIQWLQVTSRFVLLITASVLVLVFFSISSSQPLLPQISLRKREPQRFDSMGEALSIPSSGLLTHEPSPTVNPDEPLDKLLLNKIFRLSFMAFADSCLAGESVHFYDEVNERGKIPVDDSVRRIYMARHIIEKYIVAGAAMEVNISHRARQEILTTIDLAHPNLFNNALNEIMQLMKMNLAKDYWSSVYFVKFKEEASLTSNAHDLEMTNWSFSPRLSSVHGAADDPFYEEHASKGSGRNHDIGAY